MRTIAAAVIAGVFAVAPPAAAGLVNGGFESPAYAGTSYQIIGQSQVPGWRTTATDGQIEIWYGGFDGVPSQEGRQHAELNANQVSTLFQDVTGVAAGSVLGFQFAHRGRQGTDTLRLTITDLGTNGASGGGDDTVLFTSTYSTSNTAWQVYSGGNLVAPGNPLRFAFASVSSVGGASIGNFLDAVSFDVVAAAPNMAVAEPASLSLLALPLLGMVATRRRRGASRA